MATAAASGRASSIEALHGDPARDIGRDLYEKYAHNIYAFCFSRLGTREEAEDATQTTFLNACRSLRRGVVPELELAWLLKIANHVILNRRRAASRRRRIEMPHDLTSLEHVFPAREHDVDELIGIDRVIASLPGRQRQAFVLREMQGLSYREVAEELGLSQAAVETLLFRARRSLAQRLEQPTGLRARLAGFDIGAFLAPIKFLLSGAGVKVAAATLAVVTPVAIEAAASGPAEANPAFAAAVTAAPSSGGLVDQPFSTPIDLGPRSVAARPTAAPTPYREFGSAPRGAENGDPAPVASAPATVATAGSAPAVTGTETPPSSVSEPDVGAPPLPSGEGVPQLPSADRSPAVGSDGIAETVAGGSGAPAADPAVASTDAQDPGTPSTDVRAVQPPSDPSTNGQGATHRSNTAAAVSGGVNRQGAAQQPDSAAAAPETGKGSAPQSEKAATAKPVPGNAASGAAAPGPGVQTAKSADGNSVAATAAAAADTGRPADTGRSGDRTPAETVQSAAAPDTSGQGSTPATASTPDPPGRGNDAEPPSPEQAKDAAGERHDTAAHAEVGSSSPSENANPGAKSKAK